MGESLMRSLDLCSAPDHQVDPSAGAVYRQDVSRPRLDLGKLREANLKDYAIRFAFGGAVSVVAALIGHWTTERFGGIFTAFPAILLASLTLIGRHDGQEASAEDAEGGAVGALALVAAAVFLAATLARVTGVVALLASVAVWLLLATARYALAVRLGWLRNCAGDEQRQPQPHDQRGTPMSS